MPKHACAIQKKSLIRGIVDIRVLLAATGKFRRLILGFGNNTEDGLDIGKHAASHNVIDAVNVRLCELFARIHSNHHQPRGQFIRHFFWSLGHNKHGTRKATGRRATYRFLCLVFETLRKNRNLVGVLGSKTTPQCICLCSTRTLLSVYAVQRATTV